MKPGPSDGPFVTDMAEVLLISYFFPPAGGGGVIRASKLAKYLPEFGYVPTVLSAYDPRYVGDPGLLEELPKVAKVYRVQADDPFARVANLYKRFRGRLKTRGRLTADSTREPAATRLRRIASFPDPFSSFYRAAVAAFYRIPARYKFRAIISTAPPYTVHLVGRRLANASRLPLILDYRDAWTRNPFLRPPTPLHAAGWRFFERRVLSAASAVVTVTDEIRADYRLFFRPKAPVYTIPNGYDEDDFTDVVPEYRDRFTITYTGKLYEGRNPFVFLEAVRRAISNGVFSADDIAVRFIGEVPARARAALRNSGLPVSVRGQVPHDEAILETVSADAVLLIINEREGARTTLTGKIFEYLRAGRAIIAFVPPDGAAATLIREMDAGYVIRPDDVGGAVRVLGDLFDQYTRGELRRSASPRPALLKYSRREIARQFAEVLGSVISQ